jgi:DNA-binding IclR family transcriptional regulator
MEDVPISGSLRNFIGSNIQSVEQLEILCLLVEDPSKSWTVTQAYRRIQSTEKSVLEGLQYFVAHDLFTTDASGAFRFSPKTSKLGNSALELVKTYRERRVAVIETIYEKPIESVQHFADAFRLRKEK